MIELVIVMVLTAILAIGVGARFVNITLFSSQFNDYNEMLNSLRYAQKFAVGTGCHIQVAVTSTTMTLMERASCSTGPFNVRVYDPSPTPTQGTNYVKTMSSGNTMSTPVPGDWPIYFDGLGVAHRSSDDTITSTTYTLIVSGTTINIAGQTGFAY